ncbi:MAG TPA: extracellular solute-binding protein [Bacteroidota bacterium]|nr:extracellular solute-binding protein [Bacteroidota bacterium]
MDVTPRLARRGALLCILLVAWGCGPRPGTGPRAASGIELTYWPAPNPQEIQLADTLVRIWNALHPDIHVAMQPIPVSISTEEVLLAAIAGKTTPDVCSNILPAALHDYMQAGGLVRLDEFPDFDSAMASRTPRELMEQFRAGDGHFYQVPWKTNPVMMFLNRRLLREAGVDSVPATYGEYLAAGARVLAHPWPGGAGSIWLGERDVRPLWWQRLFDFFPFYIAATGGRTLFSGGKATFDDSAATGVLEFFRACYGRGYFPHTYFSGGDPFLLEKKATHFSGPWEVAAIRKFAPQLDFEVAPIPVPDGHHGPVYTYGDYKNISIFSTTAHPREAWAFVRFLVEARHDLLLLSICDQIPVRGDLLANPLFAQYFRDNPAMVQFAHQALYTRSTDAVPDLKEIFDAIAQEYEACAVYGRVAAPLALRDAVRRSDMIMEWDR